MNGIPIKESSPIHQSDKPGIGEVINDVETAVILLKMKHPGKMEPERFAQNDPIHPSVPNKENFVAFLFFQNILQNQTDGLLISTTCHCTHPDTKKSPFSGKGNQFVNGFLFAFGLIVMIFFYKIKTIIFILIIVFLLFFSSFNL